MKTTWPITLVVCLLSYISISAQGYIYPGLTGEGLKAKLIEDYKPAFVELYRDAREILYSEIDNVNDTVHTIYTDHTIYLPPTELRPISYLAQNGTDDGINAEHIYPRSKGAKEEFGNAFSDMHNLYACRWEVNGARSNFSFAEVLDTDTDYWFYKKQKLTETTTLSNEQIQLYSELDDLGENHGFFEPRESVKGNVARAVFYFYTMYRDEAMRSDPNFFSGMRKTLCQWHVDDPIDASELARSQNVALYQDGKNNPFAIDCTLANRLYCPENPPTCTDLSTDVEEVPFELDIDFDPLIKVFPNPNDGRFQLDVSNIKPGIYSLEIFTPSGRRMYSITEYLDYFNTINLWNAKSGLHFVHLTEQLSGKKYSTVFQIIRR